MTNTEQTGEGGPDTLPEVESDLDHGQRLAERLGPVIEGYAAEHDLPSQEAALHALRGIAQTVRENYMSPKEVAGLFGVSSKSAARWGDEGLLPMKVTLGGHRRFLRTGVVEVFTAGFSDTGSSTS